MAGKNTHMTHLEDAILVDGLQGGKDAIEMLRYMGEFLSGAPSGKVKVTTKWDGAPAIICGTDPADGRFFIGTKSVFNKNNPKIAKSESDIQRMYEGGVVPKLLDAFKQLRYAKIKGVLQGDLMFTGDKVTKFINKTRYITFTPNTITYAVDPKSKLGKEIARASIGVVFHTKYIGPNIQSMTPSFDVSEEDWGREVPGCWIQKAEFTDIAGVATMSAKERDQYEKSVNRAEGSLKQAGTILNKIQSGKKTLEFDTEFLKFFNNYVKAGKDIPSVDRAYEELMIHFGKEYDKVIGRLKTVNSQLNKAGQFLERIIFMEENEKDLKMLIALYMNLQYCKNILVGRMKKVSSMRLFVNKGDNYEVTTPEGFVGISSKATVKLVDRLEFSRLNFEVPKNWGDK